MVSLDLERGRRSAADLHRDLPLLEHGIGWVVPVSGLQGRLFDTAPKLPQCPHGKHDGGVMASAVDCLECNHSALNRAMRWWATYGAASATARARAHAFLDELGIPAWSGPRHPDPWQEAWQ